MNQGISLFFINMDSNNDSFNQFAQGLQKQVGFGNNQINRKKIKHNVRKLVADFQKNTDLDWKDQTRQKIHVSSTISKMAFLYEKIRVAIDYKDEHLLRKNAIERILIRRLSQGKIETFDVRTLVIELVRAGYLKNHTVPESVVEKIKMVFIKYIDLMRKSSFQLQGQQRARLNEWILNMAAVEIEHQFFPYHQKQALLEYAYSVLYSKVTVDEEDVNEQEKNTQLYIAIQRALVKSDNSIIRYSLLNLYYPDWEKADENLISEIAGHIIPLKKSIEGQIENPIGGPIFRQVKKYIIILTILKDIIKENPGQAEEILSNPKKLEEKIIQACRQRYKKARDKLKRSTIRSVVYIILTKTVLAFILELPFDILAYNTVHYLALLTNVIFHPLLLILIAANITIPAKKNTEKVIKTIRGLVYEGEEEFAFTNFKKPIKRRAALNLVFNILYLLVFSISFGVIIFVLRLLDFNIVSIFLFLLFLCLVSFFGIKNRETMRELIIVDKKKNFAGLLVDFFSIPILRMGRWLSLNAPKINVFTFILDFIIEAPFKTFVDVMDEWMNFIREKKEEIF